MSNNFFRLYVLVTLTVFAGFMAFAQTVNPEAANAATYTISLDAYNSATVVDGNKAVLVQSADPAKAMYIQETAAGQLAAGAQIVLLAPPGYAFLGQSSPDTAGKRIHVHVTGGGGTFLLLENSGVDFDICANAWGTVSTAPAALVLHVSQPSTAQGARITFTNVYLAPIDNNISHFPPTQSLRLFAYTGADFASDSTSGTQTPPGGAAPYDVTPQTVAKISAAPGAAAAVVAESPYTNTITAGQDTTFFTSPIIVHLEDAYGNRTSGTVNAEYLGVNGDARKGAVTYADTGSHFIVWDVGSGTAWWTRAGVFSLKLTSGLVSNTYANALTVNPAASSALVVNAGLPASITAGVNLSTAGITVTVYDAYGNKKVDGVTGTPAPALNGSAGAITASAPADTNGYPITLGTAGPVTRAGSYQLALNSNTGTASRAGAPGDLTVNPAASSALVVNAGLPASITAGVNLSTAGITVTVYDAYGNKKVDGVTGTPTPGLNGSAGAITASAPADTNGYPITLGTAGPVTRAGSYQLALNSNTGTASWAGAPGDLTVTPAAPSVWGSTGLPITKTAGDNINTVTVTVWVEDAYGNKCSPVGGSATLTFSGYYASLVSGTTAPAWGGGADTTWKTIAWNPSSYALTKAGVWDATLSANGFSLAPGVFSPGLTVMPDLADHFTVTGPAGQPPVPSMPAGGQVIYEVRPYDQYGNVTQLVSSTHVYLQDGLLPRDTVYMASGSYPAQPYDYVATFHYTNTRAGQYFLNFTNGSLPNVILALLVTPGAPYQIVATQPATSIAAGNMYPSFQVTKVVDQYGNKVAAMVVGKVGTQVVGSTPAVDTTGYPATWTPSYTFTSAGAKVLALTTDPAGATLNWSFNVTPGPPFSITASPAGSFAAGNVFPSFTVVIRDQYGNKTLAAVNGSAAPFGAVGAAALPADTNATQSFVGSYTFTRAGAYTLALVTSPAGATLNSPFTVTPAAPSVIVASPVSTLQAGNVLPSFDVTVLDNYGNKVVAAVNGSVAPFGAVGSASAPADTNGYPTTFVGSYTFTRAGAYTLALASSPAGATKNTSLTITPAAASTIVATGFPQTITAGAQATALGPVTVQVQDQYGNGVAPNGTVYVQFVAAPYAGNVYASAVFGAHPDTAAKTVAWNPSDYQFTKSGQYDVNLVSGALTVSVVHALTVKPNIPRVITATTDRGDFPVYTIVNTPITLTVTVKDIYGNPVNPSYDPNAVAGFAVGATTAAGSFSQNNRAPGYNGYPNSGSGAIVNGVGTIVYTAPAATGDVQVSFFSDTTGANRDSAVLLNQIIHVISPTWFTPLTAKTTETTVDKNDHYYLGGASNAVVYAKVSPMDTLKYMEPAGVYLQVGDALTITGASGLHLIGPGVPGWDSTMYAKVKIVGNGGLRLNGLDTTEFVVGADNVNNRIVLTVTTASTSPDTILITNIRSVVDSNAVTGIPQSGVIRTVKVQSNSVRLPVPLITFWNVKVYPGAPQKLAWVQQPIGGTFQAGANLHAGASYDSLEIQDQYGNKIRQSNDIFNNVPLTLTASKTAGIDDPISGTIHSQTDIWWFGNGTIAVDPASVGTGGRRILGYYAERAFSPTYIVAHLGVLRYAVSSTYFTIVNGDARVMFAQVNKTTSHTSGHQNFPITVTAGSPVYIKAWMQDSLGNVVKYNIGGTHYIAVTSTAIDGYFSKNNLYYPYAYKMAQNSGKDYLGGPDYTGTSPMALDTMFIAYNTPTTGPRDIFLSFYGDVGTANADKAKLEGLKITTILGTSTYVYMLPRDTSIAVATSAGARNTYTIKATVFDQNGNPVPQTSVSNLAFSLAGSSLKFNPISGVDVDTVGSLDAPAVNPDGTISIVYRSAKIAASYVHPANQPVVPKRNVIKIAVTYTPSGFRDTVSVALYSGPPAKVNLAVETQDGSLNGVKDTLVAMRGEDAYAGADTTVIRATVWDAFNNPIDYGWKPSYERPLFVRSAQFSSLKATPAGAWTRGRDSVLSSELAYSLEAVDTFALTRTRASFIPDTIGGAGLSDARGRVKITGKLVAAGVADSLTVLVRPNSVASMDLKPDTLNSVAGKIEMLKSTLYDQFLNPIDVSSANRNVFGYNVISLTTGKPSGPNTGKGFVATSPSYSFIGTSIAPGGALQGRDRASDVAEKASAPQFGNAVYSGTIQFQSYFFAGDTVKIAGVYDASGIVDTIVIYSLPVGAPARYVFISSTASGSPSSLVAGSDTVLFVIEARDAAGNPVRNTMLPAVPFKALGIAQSDVAARNIYLWNADSGLSTNRIAVAFASRAALYAGTTSAIKSDPFGRFRVVALDYKAEGPVKFVTSAGDTSAAFTWLPAPIAAFDLKVLTYPGQQPTDSAFVGRKFYLRVIPLDQYGNQNLADSILAAIGARYPGELTPTPYTAPTFIKGVTLFDYVPTVVRNDQRIYCFDYPVGSKTGAVDLRVVNNAPKAFALLTPANGDSLKLNSYAQTFDFNWNATTTPFNASGWGLVDTVTYKFVIQGTGPYAAVKHEVSAGTATHVTLAAGTESSPGTLMYLLKQVAANTYAFVWYVEAANGALTTQSSPYTVVVTKRGIVSVKEGQEIPKEFSISQNYPNPFNPTTTIKFGVPKASPVTLEIYNILGEKVRTLLNGENFEPGYWTVNWDGKDNAGLSVPSGIYFYRIVAGDFVKTMKMMMLK